MDVLLICCLFCIARGRPDDIMEGNPDDDAVPSADGQGISQEMLAQTINKVCGIGVGDSDEVGWLHRRQLAGAQLWEGGRLLHREASPTVDDDNLYTEEWEEYGAGEEEVATCIETAIGSNNPAELVAAAAGVLPASVEPPPIYVPTTLSYRHSGHLPLPGPALFLPSLSSGAAQGHNLPQSPTVSSSSRSSSVAGSAGGRRHSGRQRSGGTPRGATAPDGVPLMDSLKSILDNA